MTDDKVFRRFRSSSDDDLVGVVQDRARGAEDRHAALVTLFERHHGRVYEHCRRLLQDSGLARDATQEIFLKLLEKPIVYRKGSRFRSWLYILVRNHCFNVLRRRRWEIQGSEGENWLRHLEDPTDPQKEYRRGELAELVRRICAERLTPREQEVIHLRFAWGLRLKQIDEFLGLENVSGSRTHLATALRKLRTAFREMVGEDGARALLGED